MLFIQRFVRITRVARFSFVGGGLAVALLTQSSANSAFAQITPNPGEIVAAHNKWRAEVGAPPLRWSAEVAASAAQWAERLQGRGCDAAHSPQDQRPGMGENLFWASANMGSEGNSLQDIPSAQVVESWGSEKQWYDATANSCRAPANESCGHYTQVVWSKTEEVGCAAVVCADKAQVWVCQYKPAGNFNGERPFGGPQAASDSTPTGPTISSGDDEE